MKHYKKMLTRLASVELMLAMICFAATVIFNFIEIMQRNLFSDSFPWIQELSLILICWIVFMGAAYIYETQSLINVDFLYAKARGKVKLVWDIVIALLIFAVMLIVAVYGFTFFKTQNASHTFALNAPRGLYSLPLVLCAVSMMLSVIGKLYDAVADYRKTKEAGL